MKLKYNELIFDVNGDVNNYYTKNESDSKYAKLNENNTFLNQQNYKNIGESINLINDDLVFKNRPEIETKQQIWFRDNIGQNLGVIQYIYTNTGYESFDLLKTLRNNDGTLVNKWRGLNIQSTDEDPNNVYLTCSPPLDENNALPDKFQSQIPNIQYVDNYSIKGVNRAFDDYQSRTSSFTSTIANDGIYNCNVWGLNGALDITINGHTVWHFDNQSNTYRDLIMLFKKGDVLQFSFTNAHVGNYFVRFLPYTNY